MTPVDRLLRLAVRRWPAGLREEQARESAAELAALRAEPGRWRVRRGYERLAALAVVAAAGARPVPVGAGTVALPAVPPVLVLGTIAALTGGGGSPRRSSSVRH